MSEDEISFYSRINKKKNNKSPILRVRIKKEQKIINSNSTKNIDRNHLQLKIPLTTKNNLVNNQRSKNTLTKFNSITYFNKDKKDTKEKEREITLFFILFVLQGEKNTTYYNN